MLVSFHAPSSVHNMVIYFQIKESGKSFIEGFVRDRMDSFVPKNASLQIFSIFSGILRSPDNCEYARKPTGISVIDCGISNEVNPVWAKQY